VVRQYVPSSNQAARAHLLDAGHRLASRDVRMRIDLAQAPDRGVWTNQRWEKALARRNGK
jgi:hypothetical protein